MAAVVRFGDQQLFNAVKTRGNFIPASLLADGAGARLGGCVLRVSIVCGTRRRLMPFKLPAGKGCDRDTNP